MGRALLATCTLSLAVPADAQPVREDLQPGDRVRVGNPGVSAKPIVGRLQSIDDAVLVLERRQGSVTLRRDATTSVEKSMGRRPRRSAMLAGALLGGLFIAGASAACPAICVDDGRGGCLPCGGESRFDYTLTALGVGTGLCIGSLFRTEKWRKVEGAALSLEAAPLRGGARVALRFGF